MVTDDVILVAQKEFDKTTEHLKTEFSRLNVGRANAGLVENIPVEIYGSTQPIKAVASISIPEPRSIFIQPWDKSCLSAIEKGITGVGIGLNPVNDGVAVRINIPPLTEDRRKELVKHVNKLTEEARITIRTARQDAHNELKKLKEDSKITEDNWHEADEKLQARVVDVNKKIDELAKSKEVDVMTV